jgi:hypothetical protein
MMPVGSTKASILGIFEKCFHPLRLLTMIKSATNDPIRHNHVQHRRFSDQTTQEKMREFVSAKYSRPYHSQLHSNQFELLCIDDDPVFQVFV